MTFDPMDLSITGLAPVAVSLLVVGLHVYRHGSGALKTNHGFDPLRIFNPNFHEESFHA